MEDKKFIMKFNGGNLVILCSGCRKIIREATINEVFSLQSFPPQYCEQCKSIENERIRNKN